MEPTDPPCSADEAFLQSLNREADACEQLQNLYNRRIDLLESLQHRARSQWFVLVTGLKADFLSGIPPLDTEERLDRMRYFAEKFSWHIGVQCMMDSAMDLLVNGGHVATSSSHPIREILYLLRLNGGLLTGDDAKELVDSFLIAD